MLLISATMILLCRDLSDQKGRHYTTFLDFIIESLWPYIFNIGLVNLKSVMSSQPISCTTELQHLSYSRHTNAY